MNGQWLGTYSGTNSGLCVLDIDNMGEYYQGYAYVIDDGNARPMPSTFAPIKTPDKGNTFQLSLEVYPIHPQTGDPTTWAQIENIYPEVIFPTQANVNWSWDGLHITINWLTNIGTHGSANLDKSRADEPSEYSPLPTVSNWQQFKAFVNSLEPRRFIFRGQKERRRLRTYFHRTGRADLIRFLGQDRQTLVKHLSARTQHIFNLENPDENGAFLNLVQHHGYPTPLLDWTYSPYVGAYFAYYRIKNSESENASADHKVRIFIFDQQQWHIDFPPIPKLSNPKRHFSIMEFMAINNERMIPQQAVSSVTNIDDIETFIRSREISEKQYLRVIDLPVRERRLVMQELSTMGITAGSLFPGLDGACEELRERFFTL